MKSYLILPCLLLTVLASAQISENRRTGELIVALQGDVTINGAVQQLNRNYPPGTGFYLKENTAETWRIYLIGFDETAIPANKALEDARNTPGIRMAQFNHRVSERYTEPNDPDWWRQTDMTLINAPDAWDISTGGLTTNGDTIVIAILEKGALSTHPDLIDNHWFNWGEIPNNGIDDDNNGYVDDYAGFDARNGGDGSGNFGSHGTGVNGIIGASGNNGTGVSGVNWKIQLLNISNTEYEDEIIHGYEYAALLRKHYNQSNGSKGAFVVATNASFGIDEANPADYPAWCAVYDSLGAVGILSIGATSNVGDRNIDIVGDMPTACPSQYLMTVTNVDKLDNKVSGAGYGIQTIDIGAPGQDTYTTSNTANGSPSYGTIGGTSAAAPHVTGSVGLLYSLNCSTLTEDALSNPDACARRVRDIIFNSAAPNSSLANRTTTGGRLDLGAAVASVQELCGVSTGPLDILSINPNPTHSLIDVRYQTPSYDAYQFRIFNSIGQLIFEETLIPDPFHPNKVQFDMSAQAPGMYTASISRYKFTRSKKFFKF